MDKIKGFDLDTVNVTYLKTGKRKVNFQVIDLE